MFVNLGMYDQTLNLQVPHHTSYSSMYIEDIQVACRKVLKGDKDAIKDLGLDNISYSRATPHSLANNSLQATYNSVVTTAVAARELQLDFF